MLLGEEPQRVRPRTRRRGPGGRRPGAARGTAPGRTARRRRRGRARRPIYEVRLAGEHPLGRAAHRDAGEVGRDGDLERTAREPDLHRRAGAGRRRAGPPRRSPRRRPVPQASVSPAPRSQTTRSMPPGPGRAKPTFTPPGTARSIRGPTAAARARGRLVEEDRVRVAHRDADGAQPLRADLELLLALEPRRPHLDRHRLDRAAGAAVERALLRARVGVDPDPPVEPARLGEVAREAADRVPAHLGDRAVGVVDVHRRRRARGSRRQDRHDAVRADAAAAIADAPRPLGRP